MGYHVALALPGHVHKIALRLHRLRVTEIWSDEIQISKSLKPGRGGVPTSGIGPFPGVGINGRWIRICAISPRHS